MAGWFRYRIGDKSIMKYIILVITAVLFSYLYNYVYTKDLAGDCAGDSSGVDGYVFYERFGEKKRPGLKPAPLFVNYQTNDLYIHNQFHFALQYRKSPYTGSYPPN